MANLTIGHASIDENSKILNGQDGDQNGKEVCTRSYYIHSKGWYALRPKNVTYANAIADAMIRACNNNNIGYDQNNRLGIITYGTNSTVKTECDCSSLVRQCVIEGTSVDAGNFTTANEKTMLLATGLFDVIEVTSSTTLYNGDILVTKTKGHTVIVVEGNPRLDKTTSSSKGELMKGIDISKYQTNAIDFVKAKEAGYEFVFIRIGHRTTKDPYFESNYTRAKSAGMKIGVYYYTYSLNVSDGKTDAQRVLGWLGNKTLDMSIAYDMEESSMKLASRKDINSQQYNAFSTEIKANGFVPMLYTGEYMFNTYFNKDLITDHLWIAKYGKNDGNNNGSPSIGRTVAIHQYTSASILTDFYTAKLDRNQMMISYDELMKKSSTVTTPSTTTTRNYLMKGDKGNEVKELQENLNYIGYSCGTADGDFGTKTDTTLRKFQTDYKLTVDGKYGANSKTKLLFLVSQKRASIATSTTSSKYMYNGVDYSYIFDPTYYANKYVDLKNAFGTNATALFNHFTVYGMKEGRMGNENFNVQVYKANYKDLQNAFGEDLPSYYRHYIKHGKSEGRKAV